MDFPTELKYTSDHEWVSIDGKKATIGVTHYAIEQLGDIVHIELPEVDEEFDSGTSFGTIESTKTVSDLYIPVTGRIVEVNDDLINNLDTLQEDPYEDGWLVKIEITDSESGDLMDAKAYEAFISED